MRVSSRHVSTLISLYCLDMDRSQLGGRQGKRGHELVRLCGSQGKRGHGLVPTGGTYEELLQETSS
jgi:hypothetical protein